MTPLEIIEYIAAGATLYQVKDYGEGNILHGAFFGIIATILWSYSAYINEMWALLGTNIVLLLISIKNLKRGARNINKHDL